VSRLARDIVDELRAKEQERVVAVTIDPEISVEGDAHLVRLLLTNLIGNAWKFTRNEDDAEIRVGREVVSGESRIFVRDNGVGFDMQYAHKLFGVFQRLHRIEEFEGIGIGLANVRRIVERHGGRTWAEAAPGRGATFFFSLPRIPPLQAPPESRRRQQVSDDPDTETAA
jgi:light-regulated signal transduction histidine kinase (bacteriophytochrome)